MLSEQRYEEILNLLNREGSVKATAFVQITGNLQRDDTQRFGKHGSKRDAEKNPWRSNESGYVSGEKSFLYLF